jgi:hypothetical protein
MAYRLEGSGKCHPRDDDNQARRRKDAFVKVLAISLIATVALSVGAGCGSTDSEDNSSGNNSGNAPALSEPVSDEEAQRRADCLQDIRSDRDSDDPREAAANDGCLDVYENDPRATDQNNDSSDDSDPTGDDRTSDDD